MPFLTQGKTNWKYIIIVLIFAVIIGAGILGWIKKQEVPLTELPEIKKPEKVEEEKLPYFEDLPVSEEFKDSPALPDFSSNPDALLFITRITEGAKEGPNFAGHYTIIEWGCGTECQSGVVVDAKTGTIYSTHLPLSAFGREFQIDSYLLIINPPEIIESRYPYYPYDQSGKLPAWVYSEYYRWENNQFVLIYRYKPEKIIEDETAKKITVQYPHKGEVFLTGETCTICSELIKKDVVMDIALYMSNGNSGFVKIFEKKNIIPKWSGLYYNFEFPENLQTEDTYQIYISSGEHEGYSEPFTIVGEDDWRTYRNEEHGYEFKYPLSINKENPAIASFFDIEAATSDPGYEVCEFFHPGIGGTVKGKKLKINNADFCAMTGTGGAAGTVDVNYIYITEKGGKYFTIKLYDRFASRGTCECYCRGFDFIENLFNQMLSTFRFLN